MRIAKVQVLKFEELNNDAKQVAIENYRKLERDNSFFTDGFTPYCVETAKEAGFEEPKFQYSLSYSQGDGLSFSAKKYNKLVDLFKEVLGPGKDKTAQLLSDNMTQVFKGNNGHYTYASSSDVDLYLENLTSSINVKNTDRIDYIVDIVRGKLEVLYLALCKQLENEGYADLEERDSDVCISNMIIANEFEFTKDGERTRF